MRENLLQRGELGASVAVFVEGRLVADLWCGWADQARTRPWRKDTLVNVFSVGKAFAGLCVLMLVSRGLLDLDEPVSRRWPQFASAGKEAITVREVLSHQAGLAAIERQLPDGSLYDWEQVTEALAQQRPWWSPGSGHGYHVHTFGFLAGEIVRRVVGESIGSFMEREVAQRLGIDVRFGVRQTDQRRRADYIFDFERAASVETAKRAVSDGLLRERAYLNPPGATGIGTVNTLAWQQAELPSANLHGSAVGIAGFYDALLSDVAAPIDADVLLRPPRRSRQGRTWCLAGPHGLALDSSSLSLSAHLAPTRAALVTSAPAGRWASPIQTPGSPSPTR